jgi:hypothetical protein
VFQELANGSIGKDLTLRMLPDISLIQTRWQAQRRCNCTRSRAFTTAVSARRNKLGVESTPAFIRIAGDATRAYNEAALRYFLAVERKRAERSLKPLLLMLVALKQRPGARIALAPDTSAAIFSALGSCVREVDFVGWYRESTVAAVVLVPTGPASQTVRQELKARVLRALRAALSTADAARAEVRVVGLGRDSRM